MRPPSELQLPGQPGMETDLELLEPIFSKSRAHRYKAIAIPLANILISKDINVLLMPRALWFSWINSSPQLVEQVQALCMGYVS